MATTVDLEYMGGSSAGKIDPEFFAITNPEAFPTGRLLDGSRDHGFAQEWAERGTVDVNGEILKAQRIYLFHADDIDGRDPEDYPWDMDHVARIVITE